MLIGWVNAGILAGFAALAIPVLIHLLRSRRFRPAALGSLRFLEQAARDTVRWRRLQDLLLLAARLIALALLTLLFARPFSPDLETQSATQIETLLLIDTSGSMAAQALGVANIELARDAARRLLDSLPANAPVTLAAFAADVREIERLDDTELRPGGPTDYGAALRWARDRLALSEYARQRLWLITDRQAAGLPERPATDWPLNLDVRVLDCEPPGTWNAAVAGVRNPAPYFGAETTVEVELAWFGDTRNAPVTVTLEMPGYPPQEAVTQPGTATVAFPWTPGRPGLHPGRIRIDAADAYPRDNTRHFVLPVHNPHRILLVDGAPGQTPFTHETYFIETALKTSLRPGMPGPFTITRRTRELGDLTDFDGVALGNVAQLEGAELHRLVNAVAKGLGLIYFLGDQVRPDAYRALARARIFPGTLTVEAVPVPRQIMNWDATHPALSLFDQREKGDLARIVFRDTFRIAPESEAVPLATLSNDAPAILETQLGRGRIVVVANPCDRDWSDWPTERVFLPLIHELFSYVCRPREQDRAVLEKTPGMSEPREPGIYDGTPLTVIAPAPAEMDIRTLDRERFRQRLGLGPIPADDDGPGSVGANPGPEGRQREKELWPYLAFVLLGVMFLENSLADRGRS